jgi:hypothetical protein
MLTAALVDAVYLGRTKGRHRGRFEYPRRWPGVVNTGLHRGKYMEKPEWITHKGGTTVPKGWMVWNGKVTLPMATTHSAVLTLSPSEGLNTLPALIGPDPVVLEPAMELVRARQEDQRKQEIRDLIDNELAATPIYTGMRYGRFGDSDIDRADREPVCPPVADGGPGCA